MDEYHIDFSEKLIEAATYLEQKNPDDFESKRTLLYLSSLAAEITLKAILTQAGIPSRKIRKCGHNLSSLLRLMGSCEIQAEVVATRLSWVPATRIRTTPIDARLSNGNLGTLLTWANQSTSTYTALRYSDKFKSYPPELVLAASKATIQWAREHWNDIRVKNTEAN